MNYFTIDYFIIAAFILITLVVWLYAGRGIKSMQEYVLGNRSFKHCGFSDDLYGYQHKRS